MDRTCDVEPPSVPAREIFVTVATDAAPSRGTVPGLLMLQQLKMLADLYFVRSSSQILQVK